MKFILSLCFFGIVVSYGANAQLQSRHEKFRPQIHFSPPAHWMNDPNGMVYFKHTYHLFYQYYPNGMVWGPMHWGHAVSADMIHWRDKPIALYPDSLGYIFSGSAVVDYKNTSGFGRDGKIPLVAIFTHHDPAGEKAGTLNFQNQSLAYSLDGGDTWTKYKGNPVIKNPGIQDFRDPKVFWYAAQNKWLMTLATKDRITFYSAPDLKNWKKESEFGIGIGAHGGVWECPDLFPLTLNGKTHWLLIVNLNPGGPNGGSATQYFIGNFDGTTFTPYDTQTRWLDYGPDEYAGVTWGNTGTRKVFLGWMSNWNYGTKVPTSPWRSAMTIPRDLRLVDVGGKLYLASLPIPGVKSITSQPRTIGNNALIPRQFELSAKINGLNNYQLVLKNNLGQKLIVGYDRSVNKYFIDRTQAGDSNFATGFATINYAPKLAKNAGSNIKLIVDAASVEVFFDDGLSVMTAIFFAGKPYNKLELVGHRGAFSAATLTPLKSIW